MVERALPADGSGAARRRLATALLDIAAALRTAPPPGVRAPVEPYLEIQRLHAEAPRLVASSPGAIAALHLGMRQLDSNRLVRKAAVAVLRGVLAQALPPGGQLPPQWDLFFSLFDALEDFSSHLLLDVWGRLPQLGDAFPPLVQQLHGRDDADAAGRASLLAMHAALVSDLLPPASKEVAGSKGDPLAAAEALLCSLVTPRCIPHPAAAPLLAALQFSRFVQHWALKRQRWRFFSTALAASATDAVAAGGCAAGGVARARRVQGVCARASRL